MVAPHNMMSNGVDMMLCSVPSTEPVMSAPPTTQWVTDDGPKISPHAQPTGDYSNIRGYATDEPANGFTESAVNSRSPKPPHAEECLNYDHQNDFLLNIIDLWDRRELCDL